MMNHMRYMHVNASTTDVRINLLAEASGQDSKSATRSTSPYRRDEESSTYTWFGPFGVVTHTALLAPAAMRNTQIVVQPDMAMWYELFSFNTSLLCVRKRGRTIVKVVNGSGGNGDS